MICSILYYSMIPKIYKSASSGGTWTKYLGMPN